MIARYRLKEMSQLFNEEVKFKTYLDVELAAMQAFCEENLIPFEAFELVKRNSKINLSRIQELEEETKHDVIAFTRSVSESLGEERRYLHYGLTSTDVVDTALGVIYKKANNLIQSRLIAFMEVLKEKAYQYKALVSIGRTHGIHADLTVFGLKFALYYDEFNRHLTRFLEVRKRIEVGKLSGAVGSFTYTTPKIQDRTCELLGIGSALISTQTLQRDRHAEYMSQLVLMASSIEKIALEIRHLQRTEVNEVSEAFSKGQKGSSAMPHKKNPIASENMAGCARIMRGYLGPTFENIALWHERDISHSSVERVVIPDALMLVDYMFERFTKVIKNLVVNEDEITRNVNKTQGVIHAQRVMTALIEKGLSREDAYDLVQPLAIASYTQKEDFKENVMQHSKIQSLLTPEMLEQCFNPKHLLRHVDEVYIRVFKEGKA